MAEKFASLQHHDGYVTAVMERQIDANIEEVWAMLSSEQQRVRWLSPGSIELKLGGRAKLDFKDSYVTVDSEVTACAEPNLLEFSWSDVGEPLRPIRFELSEVNDQCAIKLTVSIPDSEVVARSCAGWEAHLTMLQMAVAGVAPKFPLDRFNECREFLDKQLTELLMSEVPVLRL